jgi:hypothetical protein
MVSSSPSVFVRKAPGQAFAGLTLARVSYVLVKNA